MNEPFPPVTPPTGPPTAPPHAAPPPPPTMAPSSGPSPNLHSPPPDATIVVSGASKAFGPLVAVSDVTFSISPGITALLGPNGAGKSTLLRLMCGLDKPSTGRVEVLGANPRDSAEVRAKLGLVPQQDGIFDRETLWDFVRTCAVLDGVDDPDSATQAALAQVELDPGLERPLGSFSKGMRQRAKIAQALVGDPTVIMLDEPLNGLDPKQRRQTIALFTRLAAQGKTVVVSSHVLEEVERFGSRILVIAQGRLAAEGDFRSIRDLMDDQPRRFRVGCSDAAALGANLVGSSLVSALTVEAADRLEIRTDRVADLRVGLPVIARSTGVRLTELVPLDDDLESVFRYLVEAR